GNDVEAALAKWKIVRDAISPSMVAYLLGALADLPGVTAIAGSATDIASTGIHGDLQIGPVSLSVDSTALVVQPATPAGGTAPASITIGPNQVSEIAASLGLPAGGGSGLPGGGSIVRIPHDGYGGTLQLPLGPVQVSATAVLAVLNGGPPSFLAILGA